MDKMDNACLRRFSHKIKFDYLTADQRWGLFVQEYCRLGGTVDEARGVEDQVRRMEGLAPGDFAVVVRYMGVLWIKVTLQKFDKSITPFFQAFFSPQKRLLYQFHEPDWITRRRFIFWNFFVTQHYPIRHQQSKIICGVWQR